VMLENPRPRTLVGSLVAVMTLAGCHGGGCTLCGPMNYSLGGAVSGLVGSRLTLANNGVPIGTLGYAANGTYPRLASGFTPGTAYDVTVLIQPTNPSQSCVVANGKGSIGNADVTNIAVTCATNPARFAYVVNGGSDDVSAYTVDTASGALTAIAASPFAVGHLPDAIAVDPTGSFVYVTNQGDATISGFTIDRATGALTAIAGSPFSTGLGPTAIAIDPSSSYVYATAGGGGTVSAYAIGAGTGVLTPIAGSPYATGISPSSVAISPSEINNSAYVFIANQGGGTISIFALDGSTGTLSLASGSPLTTGRGPSAVAIDPSSHFLYVANAATSTISAFAQVSGGFTFVDGSPYPAGTGPAALAIDPTDKFLYSANRIANNISAYVVDVQSGALGAVPGSPFAAAVGPSAVAIDPTGNFAYAVNTMSGGISVYSIDATNGSLTATRGSPYAAGSLPSAIAISD
jgi:6-phosphogluconolactonase